MLSYLHSFHAGNHADILKHVTLLYTLEYFNKKNKPYTIFDTHSGRGLYNLAGDAALKTGEAENGILRLIKKLENDFSGDITKERVPAALNGYLSFVQKMLANGFYPGSPAFEFSYLSEGGNLFLTELHKTEYEELCRNIKKMEDCFSSEKKISVRIENKDGFSNLKAFVPPVIKRGFVLCDPSYEEKSDYENASEILSFVHKKWSGATILLWYPLLSIRQNEIDNMKQAILATVKNRDSHTEVLDVKLLVDSEDSHQEKSLAESIGSSKPRLYGSGMFVVNPCWNLDKYLKEILPYLSKLLSRDGKGSYSVEML